MIAYVELKRFHTYCMLCSVFSVCLVLRILLMSMLFQYVSEKIGGAKGTELEDDIVDMEKVARACLQIIIYLL